MPASDAGGGGGGGGGGGPPSSRYSFKAPLYGQLNSLERNMRDLLNDQRLPPDVKMSLYYELLDKFSRYRKEVNQPYKLRVENGVGGVPLFQPGAAQPPQPQPQPQPPQQQPPAPLAQAAAPPLLLRRNRPRRAPPPSPRRRAPLPCEQSAPTRRRIS